MHLGGVDLELEHWKLTIWRYTCPSCEKRVSGGRQMREKDKDD